MSRQYLKTPTASSYDVPGGTARVLVGEPQGEG